MKDAMKTKRKIVKIDESKCTGCGQCVTGCVEGALKIVNGKAKLVSETYCDGLGACIGECPEGAITIENREVSPFSLAAAEKHKEQAAAKTLPCGCPSSQVRDLSNERCPSATAPFSVRPDSRLANWPIQLMLVPSTAPFLQNRDLVIAADCTSYAYADFHQDFISGKSLIIACPKLDDSQYYLEKLTDIFKTAKIKSITVLHMEVPCCSGLVHITKKALESSEKKIPAREITIGIKGDIKAQSDI